ncbi:MAG: hypothetical protein QG632_759 [Candidatus Dependentiae bacterium]|nr:hypothetical protein [Candidatus Dependentiae bacterium]
MKIKSILSGLSLVLFLNGGLFPASGAADAQLYNWNYWSYEFGAGVGYVSATIPTYERSSNLADSSAEGVVGSLPPVQMKPSAFPMGDFRLGVEKSWHFAKNLTATLDFALLTPAVTVGYLVSPWARVYVGAYCPVFLNSLRISDTFTEEKRVDSVTYRQADGTEITKISGVRQTLHLQPQFSFLSPRFGADVFLSPRTLLRLNLSCDWLKIRAEQNVQGRPVCLDGGRVVWPQLTLSIKKFF